MGSRDSANYIEGVVAIRRPVTKCRVHGIFQRGAPLGDGVYFRAEHTHTVNIGRLTLNINRAHVDFAGHPEKCRDRRCRDTVHSRARLGDKALLAHAPREQRLTYRVVNFMRTRVIQVLTLEENRRAPEMLCQALRLGKRTLAPDIVL